MLHGNSLSATLSLPLRRPHGEFCLVVLDGQEPIVGCSTKAETLCCNQNTDIKEAFMFSRPGAGFVNIGNPT